MIAYSTTSPLTGSYANLHARNDILTRTILCSTTFCDSETGLRQVTCIVREGQLRLYGHVARLPAEDPPSDSFMSGSEGLDHVERASTRFMVASDGGLSEGYVHGGPGVCLGDGQTEAEVLPSQDGRGDALLRRMPPYLT